MKKRILFYASLLALNHIGFGQRILPATDPFNYSAGELRLVGMDWTRISGTGNDLMVIDGNATRNGYLAAVGREASLANGGADDLKLSFTSQSTPGTTVYAAFVLNVLNTTGLGTGAYFIALGSGNSSFASRLFIKASGSGFALAVTRNSNTPGVYSTDLAVATNHLIVLGYEMVAGSANDIARLWINPPITTVSPVSDFSHTGSAADLTIDGFILRQATGTPNACIDDISVSTAWSDLFSSPVFTSSGTLGSGTYANCAVTGTFTSVSFTGNITITGTLTNAVGASGVVVPSGGSLIQSTAGISATVNREITAWTDDAHGWHLLSSPVASQSIDPVFTDPTPENYDFYKWDEATNMWLNFKEGGFTTFTPGVGFLVAYNTTSTKSFSGTLNKDNVALSGLTLTGGFNSGWHLLGNPFSSAVTWGTGDWSLTNVGTTAKVWDESGAAYVDLAAGSGIIPAMSGFMVQVTSATGSLTIPAASRVHNTQAWYKSTEEPMVKLVANDISGKTAQESVVRFTADATGSFDPAHDSRFLAGYAPEFYSVAGGEHLSTNALPEAGGAVQIPFNFIKNDGVNYTIAAKSITGIWGPVILSDLKAGISQDLTSNPVYAFTSTAGDNPGRFVLSFSHVGVGETPDQQSGVYAYGSTVCISNPGKATIEVYNLSGQRVFSRDVNTTGLYRAAITGPTGYYIVRTTTSASVNVEKVFLSL